MYHFHPKKRFLVAMPLGVLAGLLCVYFASKTNPDIWGSMLMWTIITNRMTIGLVVGLAGAYTHHPILGFPIPWYLRGAILGVFVSLSLAFGSLVGTQDISVYGISILEGVTVSDMSVLWYTLLAGGIYGLVIDFFATRYGGEGKNIAG